VAEWIPSNARQRASSSLWRKTPNGDKDDLHPGCDKWNMGQWEDELPELVNMEQAFWRLGESLLEEDAKCF